MDVKAFLIVNGVIVTALLFFILRGRRRARPTKLDMRGFRVQGSSEFERFQGDGLDEGQPRELTVIFNYNGHAWDAFEVLGVPAGARLEDVRKAYDDLRRIDDVEAQAFYRAAFTAIEKAKR